VRSTLVLGILLIVLGMALCLWPVAQQIYADRAQRDLNEQFSDPAVFASYSGERQLISQMESRQSTGSDDACCHDISKDEGPFSIIIERIDVEAMVVSGVEPENLAKAPGFYPQSAVPGQEGNVSIAGHRTTYGAWFRRVDELQTGDEVVIESPRARYIYEVESVFPVPDNAWEVVDPTPEPMLTLTTCHPVGSAEQRLVVRAKFVRTVSFKDNALPQR